jgi:hypothetical protein
MRIFMFLLIVGIILSLIINDAEVQKDWWNVILSAFDKLDHMYTPRYLSYTPTLEGIGFTRAEVLVLLLVVIVLVLIITTVIKNIVKGFIDWFLDGAVKRGAKNKLLEAQEYLNILRRIPETDRGVIVISATMMRYKLQYDGILSFDIFEGPAGIKNKNSYERSQVALKISQFIERCQREGRSQDAQAAMVWGHAVRGLVTPEIVPIVKDIWVELSKGFPYADDGIAMHEMLSGDSVPQTVADNFNFIPHQFL